ncbi:DUF6374 family protein [Nocardia sp. NPDC050175]|uniref:DUF6374 family protein n=1 Tax=Nocardia sp. NPDC050175 TaxID=3364317 RepID=UPI0037B68FC1
MNLEQVRDQLLDAAAFGKYLPPEQLENAAGKIGEGLRVFRVLTNDGGEPQENHHPGTARDCQGQSSVRGVRRGGPPFVDRLSDHSFRPVLCTGFTPSLLCADHRHNLVHTKSRSAVASGWCFALSKPIRKS